MFIRFNALWVAVKLAAAGFGIDDLTILWITQNHHSVVVMEI